MLSDQVLYPRYLMPGEAATGIQPDGLKPELRGAIASLDMDMKRFCPIAGVEEESVGTYSQNRWHRPACVVPDYPLGRRTLTKFGQFRVAPQH